MSDASPTPQLAHASARPRLSSPTPQLAPPGAGLPALELLAARIFFAYRRLTTTREKIEHRLATERATIRQLITSLTPDQAARRVLIPRPRGLEDSSRFWSAWMTLEHLRIVNVSISRVVRSLGRGAVPPGVASTAAVKPDAKVGPEVVEAFEDSCEQVLAAAAATPDLRTPVRFAHPWFGPLDAAGWFALSAGHLRIHRVQLERIRAALAQPPGRT